jgi:hypothetical protein
MGGGTYWLQHQAGSVAVPYDRALTKAALDAGLAVAADGGEKAALAERLEPIVGHSEASGRTRTNVARVWVAPPAHAAGVVRWAVEHREVDPDGVLLHFGALLATTPVAAPVATVAGRHLDRQGVVDPARLATDLAKPLGTDRAATTAIANALETFLALGVLLGTSDRPVGGRLSVPKELAGWFTHVLIVTRRTLAIDVEEWRSAPELALLGRRPSGGVQGYPLLAFHGRGGRTMASER